MRRVFLHIGLPKTGTTYLQRGIWSHKDELAGRGLLVPGARHRRHLLATLDIRNDPNLAKRPGDTSSPWQDLVDEARDWDGDVLITHEFFAGAGRAGIRRVRDSFPDAEVHIVITARAMVDLGLSRWQEWIKNGGRTELDEYPPTRRAVAAEWGWASFDLADVLDRWGAVFPHERIHVLPMRSGGKDAEDLWRRFIRCVGQDPSGLEVEARPTNTSLGLVEIELLRRVNGELQFSSAYERGTWIRGYLGEGHVLRRSGERYRPGAELLAELQTRGDRALEMLHEGGFDIVGDLALMQPRDLRGLREPSEVTSDELLAEAARAIARLVEDVQSLTRERNALKRASAMPPDPGLRVRLGRFARRRAAE